MKKVFSKGKSKSINPELEELKEVQGEIDRLQETASKTIATIREGFVDRVLAFIDIVGSTEYKTQHSDEPEKWILILQQFGELMTEYVQELGGYVVKYIGDEVMAVFDRETRINDALNFVMRIEEIEASLKTVTKEAVRIKISVDKGKVFMLRYEGHEELDPQGTPVDRCARIAKYAVAGAVLSTSEFTQHSVEKVTWEKLGEPKLKGIGPTPVYQLGSASEEIKDLIAMDHSKSDEATGEGILADLRKTRTYRQRYLFTQGGNILEPDWEFDFIFITKKDSLVNGLLNTSGGKKYNGLTEGEKKVWEECIIGLNEDKSISLERHLTGEYSGKTQKFSGKFGSAQKTQKGKTAMVWEGTWSGCSAEGSPGALIVYMD